MHISVGIPREITHTVTSESGLINSFYWTTRLQTLSGVRRTDNRSTTSAGDFVSYLRHFTIDGLLPLASLLVSTVLHVEMVC